MNKLLTIVLSCSLLSLTAALAETVHQKALGDSALKGDGKTAKEVLEVKDQSGSDSGKIARIKGSLGQWDYIAYWFGVRVPSGDSVLRFHIYNDGEDTAGYAVYLKDANGQTMLGKLEIPADAKKGDFVNIDFPVHAGEDWSGVVVKKMDKTDKPSPWIDTVSAVLP